MESNRASDLFSPLISEDDLRDSLSAFFAPKIAEENRKPDTFLVIGFREIEGGLAMMIGQLINPGVDKEARAICEDSRIAGLIASGNLAAVACLMVGEKMKSLLPTVGDVVSKFHTMVSVLELPPQMVAGIVLNILKGDDDEQRCEVD